MLSRMDAQWGLRLDHNGVHLAAYLRVLFHLKNDGVQNPRTDSEFTAGKFVLKDTREGQLKWPIRLGCNHSMR